MQNYKTTNFYDSIDILRRLNDFGKSNLKDILSNQSFQSSDMQNVIDLCLDCNVIYIDKKSNIFINTRGKHIILLKGSTNKKYIELLKLYLLTQNPSWIFEIYKGIQATKMSLSVPESFKDMFKTFNLFDITNKSSVHWWDSIKNIRRNYEESRLTRIGREGEFLIIDFEKQRTGAKPEHISIDDDEAGYDIKSIKSKKNQSDLLIEVKNTTQREIRFFISRNEYNTCLMNKNSYKIYLLHSLKDNKVLYIFDYKLLSKHVSKNIGKGKFESVQIKPDNSFLNKCKVFKL